MNATRIPYYELGAPITPTPAVAIPAPATAPNWYHQRVSACTVCPHRNRACNCAGRCAHPSIISPALAPQCADPAAVCPSGLWPTP